MRAAVTRGPRLLPCRTRIKAHWAATDSIPWRKNHENALYWSADSLVRELILHLGEKMKTLTFVGCLIGTHLETVLECMVGRRPRSADILVGPSSVAVLRRV